MARSAVTVNTIGGYNTAKAITKDAFDIANGHSIDVSGVKDDNLRIFIETSDTEAASFAIKAGDFSGASNGDLTLATDVTAALNVFQIESARFKDSDELILIDITSTASATGNIYVTAGV